MKNSSYLSANKYGSCELKASINKSSDNSYIISKYKLVEIKHSSWFWCT